MSVPGGGVWLHVAAHQRRPSACAAGTIATTWVGRGEHPELCGRCVGNLVEPGEVRRFA